jgi:hypothetical protein
MKKTLTLFLALGAMLSAQCDINAQKLVDSYSKIVACEDNRIILDNGKSFIYDDGKKNKSFNELLNNPDIQDMFFKKYPRGWVRSLPVNYDPGRVRFEPLFKELYGHNSAEVRRSLVKIRWVDGRTISVTQRNGVDRALSAVIHELNALPAKYKKYLYPVGGTFKWRHIAGTNRLSVHSFGAAIDINVKYSAYWRWSKGAYKYQNKIPKKIVDIFERHGFIWGGKWYHYDTMHFEYRPELLR